MLSGSSTPSRAILQRAVMLHPPAVDERVGMASLIYPRNIHQVSGTLGGLGHKIRALAGPF